MAEPDCTNSSNIHCRVHENVWSAMQSGYSLVEFQVFQIACASAGNEHSLSTDAGISSSIQFQTRVDWQWFGVFETAQNSTTMPRLYTQVGGTIYRAE